MTRVHVGFFMLTWDGPKDTEVKFAGKTVAELIDHLKEMYPRLPDLRREVLSNRMLALRNGRRIASASQELVDGDRVVFMDSSYGG